ncbi:hypothetical protein GWK47_012796 [Chionoecetes opilio]|uniref:Uncharacterized protein n=1 Tax=Chionoecetes opilio TaxID=41210 RepID=A0A8J4Y550_CHIOP|nr:hypothetical protein GWK47_012796 [Chionoecetes opilio]
MFRRSGPPETMPGGSRCNQGHGESAPASSTQFDKSTATGSFRKQPRGFSTIPIDPSPTNKTTSLVKGEGEQWALREPSLPSGGGWLRERAGGRDPGRVRGAVFMPTTPNDDQYHMRRVYLTRKTSEAKLWTLSRSSVRWETPFKDEHPTNFWHLTHECHRHLLSTQSAQ